VSAAVKSRSATAGDPGGDARLQQRLRLVAVSVALAALAFIQDPGRIAADTKLDLAVDPAGFLSRSLTLWEPLGFFGQLQNQAYGYLFPVGPFFVLGDLLGLPAWVVQRLWWAAVMLTAFLGVVRLARLLGVRGDSARIIAGLAYALAPRMVTEVGVLTVEVLPFAVAPWVLIPLVSAAFGRVSARRGAALSGVAVLCAGGVNAVATAAVLPLGLLWILVSLRGRHRWLLLGWWAVSVALATLWWAVPLLLLGQYSPPFLDWIESSSVTTLITSPDTVLRGTSQWVAYVVEPGGPTWPGGWALVTTPALILATGIVAALGLAGLAARSTPYRGFLVGGVVMGAVLVSLGHAGVIQGIGAPALQEALDGVLAPLRNTHKFDLVLRLPLALGVGFAVQALAGRAGRRWPLGPRVVIAGMVLLLTVGAWPMATGSLVRDRSFAVVPQYWSEAARWLAEESPDGRALVVPGASFGIYSWGRTQDEPLQSLATSPWAVRDAVPLSSAGNIRWLDAVQERLDTGRGSPRLADAMARAGVDYVVVRNDVDRRRSATPRTVLLRQALLASGGFTPVAGFGPVLPPFRTATTVVDDGLQESVAAVEIWRVESPLAPRDPRVAVRDAASVLVVSGSAESIIDLADADVLGDRPVVTTGDEGVLASVPDVALEYGVSDGFRRSEVSVGSSRGNRSHTLRADEAFLQVRRVHDYLPTDPEGRQSVAVFSGGVASASSSGSDATALRARSNAAQPWAALDGDPFTAWVSGELNRGVGQWWELVADEPFAAAWIDVRFVVGDVAGIEPAEVTVTTDAGEITVPVEATDQRQRLPLPSGETRSLRLTLASVVDGGPGEAFGIREVDIPGLELTRAVVVPGSVAGGPIVLTARKGEQAGCAAVAGQLVCTPQLGRVGEERTGIRRIISVSMAGDYRMNMWVRPRPGSSLDRLLAPALEVSPRARASTVFTSDPANRAQAAVDGVLSTSWVASPLETRPELTIDWGEERRIRGVRIDLDPNLVASRPLRVTATINGRETTDIVSSRGTIRVPAQEATAISLRFDNAEVVRSVDPATGATTALPIGVNEIRLLGAEDIVKGPRLGDTVAVPCGFGPVLSVDGVSRIRTEVASTVSQALTDTLIRVIPCGGRIVSLGVGEHLIEARSTAEYSVESVVLEPVGGTGANSWNGQQRVEILEWTATRRDVAVSSAQVSRLLETTENFNAGWKATIGDVTLTAVRVDGWRQGWLLPPGASGAVSLRFTPQPVYVAGLGVGLLAAIALVLLALLGRRRRPAAPPPAVRGGRGWPLLLSGIAGATLLGGLPGVAAGAAGAAVARVNRPVVAGVLALIAAAGAAASPWPGRLDAPVWLQAVTALSAIAALGAACAPTGHADWGARARWRRPPQESLDAPSPGSASPG
jgi:arabinofuranan 3-O-arabinosyltransferase